MARVDVTMPQMGESIAEGTLSKWLKKIGDTVKRDEPIFEISTDKVDAEIPSPTAGTLAEILVHEGTTVAVQTLVARIETAAASAAVAAPSLAVAPASAPAASASQSSGAASIAAPPSPAIATATAASGNGNGSDNQPDTGADNSLEGRLRSKSSPLVRKMAAEHGVNISALSGSGIAGRVTKRDLLQHLAAGPTQSATPSMHAPGGVDFHGPLPEPWAGDRVETMSKMRALISDHMVASRRTSAHVTSFMEMDFTRIAKIRAAKRREFEASTGEKLSFMPFIIKATVDAIKQYPIMNSSVSGTNVIYRRSINIGIAVALDWGLLVPVIRNADSLSLTGLTRSLNDLASRARAKKLAPQEVQEGTFTITNPGVFGSLMGTPIINQPQVAIMGVGAIEKRPKVVPGADGEDTIAIRTCAYFSISFDHRVIDGAVADQFLAQVKRNVESFPENGVM
ncbi:MAG: 2-oxo acid dehydrogenase subunit E2 [Gemmatimonadota bacterium]|nr:2-oxo acid dehydrogenase subunit E2 [Gemmatimonadota bacterium]